MKYFVVNVSGFETYDPEWFFADDSWSNDDFKNALSESVEEALPKLLKGEGYICGHDVQEKIVPILEKRELKRLKPDLEVSLMGECIYRANESEFCNERPDVFSDDVWDKILKHNKMVDRKLYEDDSSFDAETED